jgi:hypothetical protein
MLWDASGLKWRDVEASWLEDRTSKSEKGTLMTLRTSKKENDERRC